MQGQVKIERGEQNDKPTVIQLKATTVLMLTSSKTSMLVPGPFKNLQLLPNISSLE
jgi:hypothetical protein